MNLLSSLAIKMYSVKSIHLCDPQNRRCIEANRSLYIWQHRTSRETHTAVASKAIKDRSEHNSQGINTWCKWNINFQKSHLSHPLTITSSHCFKSHHVTLHGMALRCVGLCESDPRNPKIWGENVGPENKKDKTDSTSTVSQKIHSFQAIVSYPTEDILILQARHVSWSHVLSRFSLHTAFQHSVPHLWR